MPRNKDQSPVVDDADVTEPVVANAVDAELDAELRALGVVNVQTLGKKKQVIPARVVYLGGLEHRSVALRGQILEDDFEVEDGAGGTRIQKRKAVSDDGTQSYDFATRDSLGRLIKERLLPSTHQFAGRAWCRVEHPDHLYEFMQMTDASGSKEFEVLVADEHRQVLLDYVLKRARINRAAQDDVEYAMQNKNA